jgi:hypothetical protein
MPSGNPASNLLGSTRFDGDQFHDAKGFAEIEENDLCRAGLPDFFGTI